MNSHIKTIVVLLFMVPCSPWYVRAADLNSASNRTEKMHEENDKSSSCLDLQDKSRGKERSLQLPQGQDGRLEQNCNCELLQEIEKNEKHRQKNQDRQAEILEELLLESTPARVPSAKPKH